MSTNNIYFHGEIRKHIYLSFPLIRSFVNDKIGLHIRAVWWRFGCPLTDCLATVEHRGFAKRKCVFRAFAKCSFRFIPRMRKVPFGYLLLADTLYTVQ